MNASIVKSPLWLIKRLKECGGSTSFYQFMDWVLNDPEFGVYSTGLLKIGKKGDFCTSPSLSSDFAKILAVQVIDWFVQLNQLNYNVPHFALVEVGPGEGNLSRDLIRAIKNFLESLS